MLILYDSNTTSFSNLGLGVLKDFCSNVIITEVLNAEYNLEFKYSSNGWLNEQLLKGNIIKANGQLFRIWDVQQDLTTIKILAKHIFFDLSKNFLEDVAPTNLNGANALNWILERTESSHQFIVNGDCSNVASARYVRKNPIDAIYNEDNSILKKFGGEIELNNFNVFLHQKRGKNSGFSIRYGKNLSGVKVEMDFSGIATRIMPQGKNGLLIDEKYIDSPLINNYYAPFYKKVDFNDIGVDEEKGIDEEQAKNELKKATLELFEKGIDKPNIAMKIDFIELSKTVEYKKYMNLERVSLGDTVKVFVPNLNLNIETRIVKIEFDCLLKRIIKLELGSVIPNIITSQSQNNKELSNQIQQINPISILNQAKDNATKLLNHPFSGNIYIAKETGELFLMDTSDPNTAINVWKWGLGGLGFSSNGINGPYSIAMTQDGKIVADFISTGTLSTSRIEGFNNLLLSISNKVDSDNLISSINLSNEKIKLESNRLEINSTYFKLTDDGRIESTSGKIGGYNLEETNLNSNISTDLGFSLSTQEEFNTIATKINNYISGNSSLTEEELELYDLNDDGVVDRNDLLRIQSIFFGYEKINGVIKIDSKDATKTLSFIDESGNVKGYVGLNGAKTYNLTSDYASITNSLTAKNLIVTGNFTNNSDRRLKHDIKELDDNYVNIVKELNPVSFVYNQDNTKHIGFVAQNMEQIFKKNNIEATPVIKDELGFYSIDYISLIGILWKDNQYLHKEINMLKERVVNE